MSSVPAPQRICFVMRVRADALAEYRQRHAEVWPQMRDALNAAGWRNYSLFASDEGMIIGYVEPDDFDAAVAAMQDLDVNARWQAEMAPFFELQAAADQNLVRLEEIFHLA